MLLGIFKITGHSMMPYLNPNDRVVASSLPYLFTNPATGDVIVFKNHDMIMVKRIMKITNKKFFLAGDNKSDSLKIQPIQQKQILGKVLLSFRA